MDEENDLLKNNEGILIDDWETEMQIVENMLEKKEVIENGKRTDKTSTNKN